MRPRVVYVRDEAAQAEEVCDRILEAREQGMELRAQAVLARTSHDSDLLELELTRRRVPFDKYGGLRYLEAAHVKDFVATAAPGGQRRRRRRLVPRAAAGRGRRPGERAPGDRGDGGGRGGRRAASSATGGSRRVADRLARGRSRAQVIPAAARESADALIAALRRRARGAAARPARRGPARRARAAGPAALSRRGAARAGPRPARRRRPSGDATRATSSPSSCSTRRSSSADIAQPPHLDEDYLTLSTIHSAKGLEWDSVHVLAVYDGNFPACMSAGTSEQIDEERRLLYVGMTRARRTLHALRAGPLPPPPARPRRRARLRQAVALPHARGARRAAT